MVDVALMKEVFEQYKLILPSIKRESNSSQSSEGGKKASGLHWGISSKEVSTHIDVLNFLTFLDGKRHFGRRWHCSERRISER